MRRQTRKQAAKALAAAGALAAGTQAYANPIRFENANNQWPWHLATKYGWSDPYGYLDLTKSATEQSLSTQKHLTYANVFQMQYYSHLSTTYTYAELVVSPAGGYWEYVLGMPFGTQIGPASQLGSTIDAILNTQGSPIQTAIPEGQETYLGMRLRVGSSTHYGWMGVVRTGFELKAFAWGYESTPDTPVGAGVPEPGTLAMLALGFAAAAARRR